MFSEVTDKHTSNNDNLPNLHRCWIQAPSELAAAVAAAAVSLKEAEDALQCLMAATPEPSQETQTKQAYEKAKAN